MINISELFIDLNQIRENIKSYRNKMSKGQKFCAVVKADAYGFGARKITKEIESLVDYFAVSSGGEFLELAKITSKKILLLDPIYENITNLAKKNCEFAVSNFEQLNLILKLAKRHKNVNYKIHVVLNTGMNRFGFCKVDDVLEVFKLLQKTQNVSIFGVFSHFYAGNRRNFANLQIKKFLKLKIILSKNFDISNIIFHISNTDGFKFSQRFDMCRIGIGMFCFDDKDSFKLCSKIIQINIIKARETVGYGLNFIAKKSMEIAVVAIGYADGIMRKLAGVGSMLVRGKLCKILAVCMDSVIIDVTEVGAQINDCVTIIGKDGDNQISVCDIALLCDTIYYEILTGISKRVKRVYIGGQNANHNRKIQSEKAGCC